MSQTAGILEQAEQHCRERGSRMTEKRKRVLSGLVDSDKALSAYELIDYCKEQFGENIPAMSIYRILAFLEEEGLVHKLNLANKYVACAHICCDHSHGVPQFLICGGCSKVKEITVNPAMISELKKSAEQAGFTMMSQQLEMDCLCDECMGSAA
ncbi:Fur family transcriptional regulator [Aliagarivorans marinus]|uniref:Fur family transcriptional regulator n=1 Tax=Aliagarivorans marinus TaxID=561965 RepID=UPI00040F90C4|nr:Fur family transcriptional regulator [Aliagarivorans marinus]